MGLFVQPQVLREVSGIYGADEKGLTSRFLIAVVESRAHLQQYLGRPMDEERRKDWERRVVDLLEHLPVDEQVIVLPDEVLKPGREFFDEVTLQMAPGAQLAGTVLRAFASKLRGQLERFTGILHVAEHGAQAVDTPCSEATVEAAAAVGRYFLAHGKAALGAVGADPAVARAERLVEHLVYNRIETFPRRDVQVNKWAGCRTPEQVDETLLELVQRGYLARGWTKREKAGATGPVYRLRPELLR